MDKPSHSVVTDKTIPHQEQNSVNQKSNMNTVQKEISVLIAETKIPLALQDFLDNIWQKVMLNISKKHTTDCSQWQSATEFVELFIWCLKPVHTSDEQKKISKMLPGVKQIIEFNCQLFHYPEIKKQQVLNLLPS